MRTLEELINKEEPAWDLIQEWLQEAINSYEVLPRDAKRAETELLNAQITTRSPMGAILYETGGILINGGWIRLLGSGSERLDRGMFQWNKGKTFEDYGQPPAFLLVADDILGGLFAINGGAFGQDDLGQIYYLAPDTLSWEPMNCGYSEFVCWTLEGDIDLFYEPYYWEGWQEEVAKLNGNQVFSFFPFLWTKEGQQIEAVSRKVVPIEESYCLTMDMQRQLLEK
ncbi:MAG: DUF2625 domain-containing protein [Capnocytophaga sp.]|nr:DUF2625 domain-containing protein [Capnocytophaga sp.]